MNAAGDSVKDEWSDLGGINRIMGTAFPRQQDGKCGRRGNEEMDLKNGLKVVGR